jgi:hypothetical protein
VSFAARRVPVSFVLVLIPVVAQSIGCSAPPPDRLAARSASLTALDVAATTSPTSVSAASLYLSNWSNAQNIWMASQLDQNDDGPYGPRIAEMRLADDWNTNQIVDYSDFFRDETHGQNTISRTPSTRRPGSTRAASCARATSTTAARPFPSPSPSRSPWCRVRASPSPRSRSATARQRRSTSACSIRST